MALETIFQCTKCDAQTQKWSGRCLECGGWGTLEESTKSKAQNPKQRNAKGVKTTAFADVKGTDVQRIKTNIAEVDRVLGGGIVPGSMILLGGEPGIGKSTLILQIADG